MISFVLICVFMRFIVGQSIVFMLGRRSLGGTVVEGLAPGRDNAGSSSKKRKLEQDESDPDSYKKPKLDNSEKAEPEQPSPDQTDNYEKAESEQDQMDISEKAESEQPSPDQSDGENSKERSPTGSYEWDGGTDPYEGSPDSYELDAITDPYEGSPDAYDRDAPVPTPPPHLEPWPPELARRSGPTMPYGNAANIRGPSPPRVTYSGDTPPFDSLRSGSGIARSDADNFLMD